MSVVMAGGRSTMIKIHINMHAIHCHLIAMLSNPIDFFFNHCGTLNVLAESGLLSHSQRVE